MERQSNILSINEEHLQLHLVMKQVLFFSSQCCFEAHVGKRILFVSTGQDFCRTVYAEKKKTVVFLNGSGNHICLEFNG